MALFGPPNVEKMKGRRDVKGLIRALSNGDDAGIRRTAAEALGIIRDARAVEPLIAALKDKDADVRRASAKALGDIGDARAAESLIAALRDESGRVRYAAAVALSRSGWTPGQGEAMVWYWIAKDDWREVRDLGPPAVQPLIAALQDRDVDVRFRAAEALGKISDQRAVEPLIIALKDASWRVRSDAAAALGKFGDRRAVEPLIAALRDARGAESAAEALESLGWQPDLGEDNAWYWVAKREWDKACALGPQAVEPLIAALQEGDMEVRGAAMLALGEIGDARAVEPLAAALERGNREMREVAVLALGEIGGTHAVKPLIAALKDEDWHLRAAAISALVQIGDVRAVEPLTAILQDSNREIREAAVFALGKIGDACAVEPLIAILKDEDWNMRAIAIVALGEIGDARAIEALIAALGHKERTVRIEAAQALVQLHSSGRLTPTQKQRVLEQRSLINSEHLDKTHPSHHDVHEAPGSCFNLHTDDSFRCHSDRGIGVDFPL